MPSKLEDALAAFDWNERTKLFLAEGTTVDAFSGNNLRLAIWSKQLEGADEGNPALPFVREMQSAGHYVTILASLALYKGAAASVRAVVECALYYIYFRAHQAELATLVRDKEFYIDKSTDISFMKVHVPNFTARQEAVGLLGELKTWYSDVSAIVHGQIPGTWSKGPFQDQAIDKSNLDQLSEYFSKGVQLTDNLFKVCLAEEIWHKFSSSSKKALIRGMSGSQKQVLTLDAA